MNFLKKAITVTACTAIIGTSLSLTNLESNNNITVQAAGKILSSKQFNSDVHALSIASELAGQDSQYTDSMRDNLINGYTTDYYGIGDFLGYLSGHDNESNYSAVKYLYHHFYNRFDNGTKTALSQVYNQSDNNDFDDLIHGLSSAISEWANKYSYVGASKQSIIKYDKHRIAIAKKNLKKHHTKKNKKALSRANDRLKVDQIKYE